MFNRKQLGFLVMGTDDNNKYNGSERRISDRRLEDDRRNTTRFSDVLGRRSGVDRRLPVARMQVSL